MHNLSAMAIVKAIESRELTCLEVTTHFLNRIEEHNKKLNALVEVYAREAVVQSKKIDSLTSNSSATLSGVPITIKEAFNIKNKRTTLNFGSLKNNIATENAQVVDQLIAAGAILMGKTNVPTMLADSQTNGPIYGRSNNPYNLEHSPGGSTGGGAAAVAAGLSAIEIGSDIAGSIRLPAHFCGLYALKPTEKVFSNKGHVPPLPNAQGGVMHMASVGILTKCIDDLSMVFKVLSTNEKNYSRAPIDWTFVKHKQLADAKIAWSKQFDLLGVTTEYQTKIEGFIKKISSSTLKIDEYTIPLNYKKTWRLMGELYGFLVGQDAVWLERMILKLKFSKDKGELAKGIKKGLKLDFKYYARCLKQKEELVDQIQSFFEDYDFFICPVASCAAFEHRPSLKPIYINGKSTSYLQASFGFTSVFNLSGHPSIVIPIGLQENGLPLGIQIVGPLWSDTSLLRVAKEIAALTNGFIPPEL
ncbi:MAG: amidase [Aureispira sp.]|nr:amidase [Aureispira sp.]